MNKCRLRVEDQKKLSFVHHLFHHIPMSRKPSGEMESDRPDPLPGFLASPPGSAATSDRPEGRLDQSEGVAPFRPLSMTLRSHSRAGRSKTPNPENVGSIVRTESEHPQPETEDALGTGRVRRKIPDSPEIDSSGETGKTPSGPILQDRPGPEMEITACPPVTPPSSNSPPLRISHNRETTQHHKDFTNKTYQP